MEFEESYLLECPHCSKGVDVVLKDVKREVKLFKHKKRNITVFGKVIGKE